MIKNPKKILLIQTAFIGDVILATALIEKLKNNFPDSKIHFLLRKGNESLLKDHPHLEKILIWQKKEKKYSNLLKVLGQIRSERYDVVINMQRFFTTGFLTAFSNASYTIGFNKNPWSWAFNKKIRHVVQLDVHEVERNLSLIEPFTDDNFEKPKLYPSQEDYLKVEKFKTVPYICIAPSSVWFTKQFPESKWVDLINQLSEYKIYLVGGLEDTVAADRIISQSQHKQIENLSGNLSLLQSAALMKDAKMNYANDSAPMHLASATNAAVCAVYCSTIPSFGFFPLSDHSFIVEIKEKLPCRPCNLHGKKECPLGHFNCAFKIQTNQLLAVLN